jgi:hypothetical protein
MRLEYVIQQAGGLDEWQETERNYSK